MTRIRRALVGALLVGILLAGYQAGEAMKGDFSRFSFDPAKHYSAVLMQQGRVQTDADWNEQVAIETFQRETRGCDIIGRSGVPAGSSGDTYPISAQDQA